MSKLVSLQSELSGQVRIPGSKSHTIRAVMFASLARGRSVIRSPLVSLDTASAVACYRALGATINTQTGSNEEPIWQIDGFGGRPSVPENIIDVGNSGTTLRMALGTASLLESGTAVFTGDEQIRRRPAGPLIGSLNDLGARAFSTRGNDLAPFVVSGTLKGGVTEIKATSSQYLSSLLANCPFAGGESKIVVTLLNEKPYVELTLAWLDRLGLKYKNKSFKEFSIPGGQKFDGFECEVPADFSSATFFLCAAALAGHEVKILGLDMADAQGDKVVIDYLRQMGAKIDVLPDAIVVSKGKLHGVELDLNATPDALPALAVTACFAEGTTRLYNVPQARMKETDRIAVMTQELAKLGARIQELPDGLIIEPSTLRGGTVDGHGDHRVVMAMALAGLLTRDPVTVKGSEAAAVTFPEFVRLMAELKANIYEKA
jgi:3-phosphoshikimate 1-carboxyvinyltransferase